MALPPTKLVYVFDGWYLDNDTFENQMLASVLTSDMTLYAKWLPPVSWDGDFILFGEYPQSIKADEVTIGTTPDSDGYFLGSDGARYAKVIADPYGSDYAFSTGLTITSQSTYYLKVAPIKWRVLQESEGIALFVADFILDNQRCHANSNHYADSEIRAWLNNEFYGSAFSELEKQRFLTRVVNNVYSTGYNTNPHVCENTYDKIFLLSYREATNAAFGLHIASARKHLTSDYSRGKEVWMNTGGFYGIGGWYLRSPSRNYHAHVRSISDGGNVYGVIVNSTNAGIVPALKIELP